MSLNTPTSPPERIRRAVADPPVTLAGGTQLPVRISAGTATMHGRAADPRLLIGAADRALYTAKRTGRNRMVSAEPPDPTTDQLARAPS